MKLKQMKNLDECWKVLAHRAWSGSGAAEGSFLLLSADETGCVRVSYLPWLDNIHRGPTPFGTLKSLFLHWMRNQPGWITRAWDMDAIWPRFIPCGVWCPGLNALKRFWQCALWQRHFGSVCWCMSRHITENHLHF